MTSKKVAVIGGGMAGIISSWAFKRALPCSVCIFEKWSQVGGVWGYRDQRTGRKGPLYDKLRTNLPYEIMVYPAFKKEVQSYQGQIRACPMVMNCVVASKSQTGSFPPWVVFQEYLVEATKELGVEGDFRFASEVEEVRKKEGGGWEVRWKEEGGRRREEEFDFVVVCNGHHSSKTIPEEFQKLFRSKLGKDPRFIHSSEFADSSPFLGCSRSLVVGTGASGGDLALELSKVSEEVVVVAKEGARPWTLPRAKNVQLVTPEEVLSLPPSEIQKFDSAIFATGFGMDLSFLPPSLQNTENLSLHIVDPYETSLFHIGLPQKVLPAPLFQIQATWAAQIAAGKQGISEKAKDLFKLQWKGRGDEGRLGGGVGEGVEIGGVQLGPYPLDDGSRKKHELGPALFDYWDYLVELIGNADKEEAESLRKWSKILQAVLVETNEGRLGTGPGLETTYREWDLQIDLEEGEEGGYRWRRIGEV